MLKNTQLFFLLTLLALLSSCYSYKNVRLLQEDNVSLPVYPKTDYADYRIRVNDEIVYRLITSDATVSKLISPNNGGGMTQNQISYRVYTDSTIDLPFLSHIPVAGLTLAEATSVVQNRMAELIPDALVKLSLANKNFTIFGDAGNAIIPIYKEKLTIFQALAMTGDLGEQIDRAHIRIIRETNEGIRILEFDIRPRSIIDSKYYYVYPNDIIYMKRTSDSFYKVNSYTGLLGVFNFSLSLMLTVLNYSK